jgi:hypothetical protein
MIISQIRFFLAELSYIANLERRVKIGVSGHLQKKMLVGIFPGD